MMFSFFKKFKLPLVIAFLAVVSVSMMSVEIAEPTQIRNPYHTMDELRKMLGDKGVATNLPVGEEGDFFRGAGLCEGCHGFDPNGIASLDAEGNDINPTDMWRATMMANSAKDPFWKAKVSHEVAVNPDHQVELEDKCTTCHAPMGHYGAFFDSGAEHYSMNDLAVDSLGLDGVSCNACHAQSPDGIGSRFSGELTFSPDTIYGPYGDVDDPPVFSQPMFQFVGFQPEFDEYVEESEMCAACHTLITETADLEGNLTGGEFVEQATYHEWLNSVYSQEGEMNRECQSCHFPRIEDPVVISANYAFLEPRTPFGKHFMVGGNTFMLELMKNRINELGISATESQFDEVIQRTTQQLLNETIELEITELAADNDTASYELKLTNLSGHKFPSGYPSRRAFIEFIVAEENGDTLFHSGKPMANYEVSGHNSTYEPHYTEISEEDQVQIYEMVLGDVNGDVTTVLERAANSLKDNRLTPLGFSTSHFTYDTTLIAGLALLDNNFNIEGGVEGSGSDRIIYKAPMDGFEGNITATARVYFQAVPPKWNEEMFAYDTPEINAFEEMYHEEGADPVMIKEVFASTFVQSSSDIKIKPEVTVFPNLVSSGEEILISSANMRIESVEVYSLSGSLVFKENRFNSNRISLRESFALGSYLLIITGQSGEVVIEKIVVN